MQHRRPSFLQELFDGQIVAPGLFPFPAPLSERDSDEARTVELLVQRLRELWHDGIIDPPRFDAEESVSGEVMAAFGEAGLFGLTIPREYGGLGLSHSGYARVFGEIASLDASLGVIVGVHCGLGSKAIVLYGNEEQKDRYLPDLATGAMYAAYALTEPATGSDVRNLTTTAVRGPDGGWVLNGRKIWIGLGHIAGVLATFAQTTTPAGKRRISAFLVRPDMPGFVVEDTERKMGIRGSSQARLLYDDLRVPDDHLLGQPGKGFAVAVNVLNGGRLSLAAGCVAGARRLTGELVRYGEHRVQFERPLADFEITQRKIAEAASRAYAADAMVGHLAAAMDETDADVSLEAAAAKVFTSELLWKTADDMVQLAGGRGYVRGGSKKWPPYPYERWLRDARINRIFEGGNEVLLLFIALNGVREPGERLQALGSALRSPLRNMGLITGWAVGRVRAAVGAKDRLPSDIHASLEDHVRYFEKHVAELAQAVERAVMEHRREILERQLVLERLAWMGIELYATACAIARTQRLIDENGEAASRREIALCDLFCVEAGRRFRRGREGLGAGGDAVDERRRAVADTTREAGGYFVEDPLVDVERPQRPEGLV